MKKLVRILTLIMIVTSMVACSNNINNKESGSTEVNVNEIKVSIPSKKDIVQTLCSDEYEGRLTGSNGNKKAQEYINNIFSDIKLEYLFGESYYKKYMQQIPKVWGFSNEAYNPEDEIEEETNNLIGFIKGDNSSKAVVISAHFDHIGYQNKKIVSGALDNAAGVSILLDLANKLNIASKEKRFNMDIIICAFNGEEEGLEGSKALVKEIKPLYKDIYNINIDSVGGKESGNISLNNTSKISDKLYVEMKNIMKKNNMEFSNVKIPGISDHKSFEEANIPNIFLCDENVKPYIHKYSDKPEILDYNKLDKISDVIFQFLKENDGEIF